MRKEPDWLGQMRTQHGEAFDDVTPRPHTLSRKRHPPANDGALFVSGTYKLTPAEKQRAKISATELNNTVAVLAGERTGRTRATLRAAESEWLGLYVDIGAVEIDLPRAARKARARRKKRGGTAKRGRPPKAPQTAPPANKRKSRTPAPAA